MLITGETTVAAVVMGAAINGRYSTGWSAGRLCCSAVILL